MRCFLIIEARGVKAVAWFILALGEFVVDLAVAYWIIKKLITILNNRN